MNENKKDDSFANFEESIDINVYNQNRNSNLLNAASLGDEFGKGLINPQKELVQFNGSSNFNTSNDLNLVSVGNLQTHNNSQDIMNQANNFDTNDKPNLTIRLTDGIDVINSQRPKTSKTRSVSQNKMKGSITKAPNSLNSNRISMESSMKISEYNDRNKNRIPVNNNKSKKNRIPTGIAPLDPNLYKVDMDEVRRKYEEMKTGSASKRKNYTQMHSSEPTYSFGNRQSEFPLHSKPLNYSYNDNNVKEMKILASQRVNQQHINEENTQNLLRSENAVINSNEQVEQIENNQENVMMENVLAQENIPIEKKEINYVVKQNNAIASNRNLTKITPISKAEVKQVIAEKKLSSISKSPGKSRRDTSPAAMLKYRKNNLPSIKTPKNAQNNSYPLVNQPPDMPHLQYKSNGKNSDINIVENTGQQSNTQQNENVKKNLEQVLKDKQSKEALLDKTKCVYCLKRVKFPIVLKCKHELCLECAKEVKSLFEFIKEETVNYIKCPQCDEKTTLSRGNLDELLRKNWKPILDDDMLKAQYTKLNVCEICPSSKVVRDFAEFECLNCDIITCYECKIRHIANPRHQDHKVIQVNQVIQEKIELTLCEEHREPLKLYCVTDTKPCCMVCANYENLHEGHSVKSVRSVLESSSVDLNAVLREYEPKLQIIENFVNEMTTVKQKLEEEQELFISRLNNILEGVITMIRNRQNVIVNNIRTIFNDKLNNLNKKLTNFSYISNRYNYYRNLICDRDIDILDRVKQVKNLNLKINKMELNEKFIYDSIATSKNKPLIPNYSSFKSSIFLDDPTNAIKKSIDKFRFLPLTDKSLEILKQVFESSNIISTNLITNDLLVALPKIKSGCLLFQISRDGPSPKTFHELCDNKGPTLLLVKLEDGHVFGGYNPISWISEYMYNECEDAYIFSITDGSMRKPMRCPIKKSLKKFAIKQNEIDYSPGFGETDNADLFIAFKNLKNSYSNLGNVYKCPKGYNSKEFLAGRPNDWKIADVEVYAVESMNEEEYFLNIKN